jgi:hypothetical protein
MYQGARDASREERRPATGEERGCRRGERGRLKVGGMPEGGEELSGEKVPEKVIGDKVAGEEKR